MSVDSRLSKNILSREKCTYNVSYYLIKSQRLTSIYFKTFTKFSAKLSKCSHRLSIHEKPFQSIFRYV